MIELQDLRKYIENDIYDVPIESRQQLSKIINEHFTADEKGHVKHYFTLDAIAKFLLEYAAEFDHPLDLAQIFFHVTRLYE